jgi:hypothetical protein
VAEWPVWGWFGHPQRAKGGGRNHPHLAWGGFGHPHKATKREREKKKNKKKKKREKVLGLVTGDGLTTPKAMGWVWPPLDRPVWGGQIYLHPKQGAIWWCPFFFFFFFFFFLIFFNDFFFFYFFFFLLKFLLLDT